MKINYYTICWGKEYSDFLFNIFQKNLNIIIMFIKFLFTQTIHIKFQKNFLKTLKI